MDRPVTFTAGKEHLVGIIHLPDRRPEARPDLGLVFVHSGSRGRLGNTFHYPYLARHLVRAGYPVLRFDPNGIGDSTGLIETCPTPSFYGSLQSGRYVGDTLAAVDEFKRQVNPRRIILLGICGGAITALLSSAVSEEVDGCVLLSVPVLFDFAEEDEVARIPAEYARRYLFSIYSKKLLSPRSWLRLLTLRSDMKTIRTYLSAILRGLKRRIAPGIAGRPKDGSAALSPSVRFNAQFVTSLDAMVARKRPVLFLFGEDDAFRWEFEREFYDRHWNKNPAYAQHCQIHMIKSCNHMFTMREWQHQAIDLSTRWLEVVAHGGPGSR